VAILGPRQVGKTTLARAIAGAQPHHFFDLEDPVAATRLANPKSALEPLTGLVVIDGIFPSLALPFPPPRFAGSGPWWRISTGRFGTWRTLPAL
jgi:hypothetical protein